MRNAFRIPNSEFRISRGAHLMWLTMALWVLAVLSGLCWARWWTGVFTALTTLSFIWLHAGALDRWSGWLQLATLAVTPWLLAAQQGNDEHRLRVLQADEARRLAQLSESARKLLALQTATQQMERQIGELSDVYHVTKETARALRLPELFRISLELAPRLLTAQGLWLIDLSSTQLGPKVIGITGPALDIDVQPVSQLVEALRA